MPSFFTHGFSLFSLLRLIRKFDWRCSDNFCCYFTTGSANYPNQFNLIYLTFRRDMLPNAIPLFSPYWVGNCSLSSTCLYLSMSKGRKISTLISCTEVMNGQNIYLLRTKYLKNTTWNKTHLIWTIWHLFNLVNSGSHTNVRKPGFIRTQQDRTSWPSLWNQMKLTKTDVTDQCFPLPALLPISHQGKTRSHHSDWGL